MGLFYRKPFALCSFMFVCGSFAGFFLWNTVKYIAVATVLAVLIVLAAYVIITKKFKIAVHVILPLLFLLFGVLYFTFVNIRIENNYDKYITNDNPSKIEATVLSRAFYSNYLCIYDVRVREIDGEKVNMRMRMESERALDLNEGEIIILDAHVSDFDSGGNFNEKMYFNSRGIYFLVTEDGESCELIGKERNAELFLGALKRKLCNRFSMALKEDTAGLVNALFMGNRDDMTDIEKRDFKRTGTYHLLALSGMHLSVLSHIFDVIMINLRIAKGKRCVILLLLVTFYVALTGFGLSVVRSAIMLFSFYLAYFLRTKSDSLTSLMFSALFILILSPSSLLDIGFWMSILATFGIIVAVPFETLMRFKLKKLRSNAFGKLVLAVLSGLVFSFAAIIFTFPFSCFGFEAISVTGPVLTLILSPLVSFILALAPFLLIFAEIPIVNDITVIVMDACTGLIRGVSLYFSEMENVYFSLDYPFVKFIVIPFFVILALLLILRIKNRIIIPAFIVSAIAVFCVFEYIYLNDTSYCLNYTNLKGQEYISISSGDENVLIDISDGAAGRLTDMAITAAKKGDCEIDTLVLTHLHKRHVNAIGKIYGQVMLRSVMLPIPLNSAEEAVFESIKAECRFYGIEAVTYESGIDTFVGIDTSVLLYRAYLKRSSHPVISFTLSGKTDLTFIGSSYPEHSDVCLNSKRLIIGAHGPICKNGFSLDTGRETEYIFIANELLMSNASVTADENTKIIKNAEHFSLYIK